MKDSLDLLTAVSAELEDDPLYEWIASSHHTDPRRHYDSFIPILGFILTFPYYNDRYLAYHDPSSLDGATGSGRPQEVQALRDVINEHVREDCTHARLFLHDLRLLDLASIWGLERPSTALWTLWVSPMLNPAQAVLRRRIQPLVGENDAWPPFRYLHIEQLEQDGHLLFSAAAHKSRAIVEATGAAPLYFGEFHLDREAGHVGGAEFTDVVLSPAQAAHAKEIITRKHAASVEMNRIMHRFAVQAQEVDHAGVLLVREQEARLARTRQRIAEHAGGALPAPSWHIRPQEDTGQRDLIAAWQRHHDEFVHHPFAELLRAADGPEAAFALRCAALLFAARICSLHPFYLFDCRPADDTAPGGNVVRFLCRTFSTEAQIFFHDWQVLQMDERLPWDMAMLLEWIFFDPTYGQPEMEALHEFRRETMRIDDDPLIKYWALMAVHFMSRAFFGATGPVTEAFARENPDLPPLVYFSGVHHLHYDEAASNWISPPHPTSLAGLPITDQQRRRILDLMDTFARVGRRQFDHLARALTIDRDRFGFLLESKSPARGQDCPV